MQYKIYVTINHNISIYIKLNPKLPLQVRDLSCETCHVSLDLLHCSGGSTFIAAHVWQVKSFNVERTVGTTFSHSLAMLLSQFLRCFCFFHSWLGSSAMIRGKGASQLCTEKKIGSLEGNALLVSQTSIFIFLCSA